MPARAPCPARGLRHVQPGGCSPSAPPEHCRALQGMTSALTGDLLLTLTFEKIFLKLFRSTARLHWHELVTR